DWPWDPSTLSRWAVALPHPAVTICDEDLGTRPLPEAVALAGVTATLPEQASNLHSPGPEPSVFPVTPSGTKPGPHCPGSPITNPGRSEILSVKLNPQ